MELVLSALLITLLTGAMASDCCLVYAMDKEQYYDIEFHRGGRDARPENSLYSYQYALENGASTIECDMQLTSDGVLVMSHNPALNPDITTYADGRRVERDTFYIHDMTLEEVKKFNTGVMDESCEYYDLHGRSQVMADTTIPALRELFELVRDSGNDFVRMSIEAKSYPDPAMGILYEKSPDTDKVLEEFLKLVREFGFEDRVILQSFNWDVLVRMKKLAPEIETIALYCEQPSWGGADSTTLWLDREAPSPWLAGISIHDFGDDPVQAAHALGIDDVSPYWEEITPELTKEAHGFGMKVVPWTVNYPEDMETLYDMGVDGMITDRPWVMREFLMSKGKAVRPSCRVGLPYHLEPDHKEISGEKAENGMDASY